MKQGMRGWDSQEYEDWPRFICGGSSFGVFSIIKWNFNVAYKSPKLSFGEGTAFESRPQLLTDWSRVVNLWYLSRFPRLAFKGQVPSPQLHRIKDAIKDKMPGGLWMDSQRTRLLWRNSEWETLKCGDLIFDYKSSNSSRSLESLEMIIFFRLVRN